MSALRLILNVVLAPLVIAAAVGIAFTLVKSKKPVVRKPPVKAIARVETTNLSPANVVPEVETFGNTSSYLETQLSSQVGGETIELSPDFDVGNLVNAGDWLIKINPADFDSILAERQSSLEAARRTLAEENSRSSLAREEWVSTGRPLSKASPFALRIPQLEAAETALKAAEATVKKAQLDIDRTIIRAPFDAVVASRDASLGEVVGVGSILGNLISREKAQVTLPLTPEQATLINLQRIKTDPIQVALQSAARPNLKWTATIQRINPVIDTRNRTVQVIAEIPKPFDEAGKELPIGAFMKAKITGQELQDVYQLAESSVVEDSYIWVVSPKKTITEQPIKLIARQANTLIVRIDDPIYPGAIRMVQRPLASFNNGQQVMVVNDQDKVQ